MFQWRTSTGEVSAEQSLSSEPVWVEIIDFAKTEVSRGVSKEEWLALVGRSAELGAINHMLNQGAKLMNVVLTSVLLTWPDEGPSL